MSQEKTLSCAHIEIRCIDGRGPTVFCLRSQYFGERPRCRLSRREEMRCGLTFEQEGDLRESCEHKEHMIDYGFKRELSAVQSDSSPLAG